MPSLLITLSKKSECRTLLILKKRLSVHLVLGRYFGLSIYHQWGGKKKEESICKNSHCSGWNCVSPSPPKEYVQVLSPFACGYGLIWKRALGR